MHFPIGISPALASPARLSTWHPLLPARRAALRPHWATALRGLPVGLRKEAAVAEEAMACQDTSGTQLGHTLKGHTLRELWW